LSSFIDEVANGTEREIVIAKSGKPMVKLVPYKGKPIKRHRGIMKESKKLSI